MFDAETTLEELKENLNFIEKNKLTLHEAVFRTPLYLVPQTPIYKRYVKEGKIIDGEYGTEYKFQPAAQMVLESLDEMYTRFGKQIEEMSDYVTKALRIFQNADPETQRLFNLQEIEKLGYAALILRKMPYTTFKNAVNALERNSVSHFRKEIAQIMQKHEKELEYVQRVIDEWKRNNEHLELLSKSF